MPLDFTGVKDALKELYPEQRIAELVFKNHPLSALMPARTDFFGRQFFVPIRHGKPQGRSHTFSEAQGGEFGSLYEGFTLDRTNDYGVAQITGEAAEAAESEPARFIETLQAEMDGMLSTMGDNAALSTYTNQGGSRGVVGSVASDVVTLANPEDVVFFEIGMKVDASGTDGTGIGSPAGNAGAVIIALDEDAGEFTVDAIVNMGSPSGGEFLHQLGDFALDAAGLDSWIPASPPSSDLFFGVDRSISPVRLGGVRFPGGSGTIRDALINANARLRRSGARISHFFLNPLDVATLELSLEGTRIINDVVSPTFNGIGFQALGVMMATGVVPIIADPDCPSGVAFGLEMSTWMRASLREMPRIFDGDGLRFLRLGNSDGFEIRGVSRYQIYCTAPGHNVRVDISNTTG